MGRASVKSHQPDTPAVLSAQKAPFNSAGTRGDQAQIHTEYIKQFDGLRALAVLGVAWYHWSPPNLQFHLPWAVGVHFFFVLSGFLITRILLRCRWTTSAEENTEKLFSLRQFYIRRVLRIIPLYYLVLIGCYIIDVPPVRESLPWDLFYLSNYYAIHLGEWPGRIAHLWALAVEQQFYILWPWVILFIPKKHLKLAVWAFVVIAPAYRLLMNLCFPSVELAIIATIGQMDTLSMGALLAIYTTIDDIDGKWLARRPVFDIVALAAFIAYIVLYILDEFLYAYFPLSAFRNTALAIVFVWIVFAAFRGMPGVLGRILEQKPLVYLGKISYGFYILHNLADLTVPTTLKWLHLDQALLVKPYIRLPIMAFWTLVGTVVLWHLFEKPIASVKKRFPYTKPAGPALSYCAGRSSGKQ